MLHVYALSSSSFSHRCLSYMWWHSCRAYKEMHAHNIITKLLCSMRFVLRRLRYARVCSSANVVVWGGASMPTWWQPVNALIFVCGWVQGVPCQLFVSFLLFVAVPTTPLQKLLSAVSIGFFVRCGRHITCLWRFFFRWVSRLFIYACSSVGTRKHSSSTTVFSFYLSSLHHFLFSYSESHMGRVSSTGTESKQE